MSKLIKTNELYLPEELLITNILTRLPIKSLLRFKSVTKRFNFIISSPCFAKQHLKKSNSSHNNNSHLLIYHDTCFLSFDFESFEGGQNLDFGFPFDHKGFILKNKSSLVRIINGNFHFPHSHIIVIGSYDGLVCFKTKYFLYIWNPTTLKCREIPLLTNFFEKEDWVWGFGCVSSGRDYKIVRICQNKRNNEKIIEIFSLLENRWTLSQEKMEEFGERPQLSGLGVSLNDVMYWSYLAYYEDNTRANGKYLWWIIGIDLVTHNLKRVPLPTWLVGGFQSRPIMYVMEGRLCACWKINDCHVVEVATLKEEGATSSWIKLHQLSHDIVLRYMEYFYDQSVPNITTKNRFAVQDRPNRDTILFIDPAQESPEDVLKLTFPISSKIFNYTESLLSPFCNDLKQI